jgi:hypothetical protein
MGGVVTLFRAAVVAATAVIAGAVGLLPMQNATASPSNAVIIPAHDATVSGLSQVLDAVPPSGTTQVQFEITGGTLSDSVIATGTPTLFGWLALWNTTAVPNGSYALQSVASHQGGVSATSPAITIDVNNAPPSTSVIIPTNGSTLAGYGTLLFDATASRGVSQVQFDITSPGFGTSFIATATLTIYGWIGTLSFSPCTAQCGTIPVPTTIQSVASYPGGVSGTSQPVNVTYLDPNPG